MKPLDPEVEKQAEGAAATDRPLVLYVEDDDENWNVTQLRLGQQFRVIRAATDVEACELVRAHGPKLHAILMDIELKGSKLSGVDLTKIFRRKLAPADVPAYAQNLPEVASPIVFVTAYGFRYKQVDLLSMGGNQVVEKPVDFTKLTVALTSYSVGKDRGSR
jgi:CheY-like chemotaxis protein